MPKETADYDKVSTEQFTLILLGRNITLVKRIMVRRKGSGAQMPDFKSQLRLFPAV